MCQFIQIVSHPAVNGPVSSGHGITALQDIAFLKDVIRDQHASGREQTFDVFVHVYILTLGTVHEYQVICFTQTLYDLHCIPLYKPDPGIRIILCKISLCLGDPGFVVFYGCDPALFRCIFSHI